MNDRQNAHINPYGFTSPKKTKGRKRLSDVLPELAEVSGSLEEKLKGFRVQFGNARHISLVERIASMRDLEKKFAKKQSTTVAEELVKIRKSILGIL